MSSVIRIAVVDDRPAMLLGLQRIFCEATDMNMVVAATTLEAIPFTEFDVLLARQSILAGAGARKEIASARAADVAVIVVVDDTREPWADVSEAAGSVCDDLSPDFFLREVRRAVDNRPRLGRGSAGADASRDEVSSLSPRELNVLKLLARGLTHGQIGRNMGISTHTVDTYIKRIRAKLDVGNKAELTRAALALGL